MIDLAQFTEALNIAFGEVFPECSESQIAELSRITVVEYIKLEGINPQ